MSDSRADAGFSRRVALVTGATTLLATVMVPVALAPAASAADTRAGRDTSAISTVLPEPTGRHPIGTVSLHLVDRSRPDPWVADQPYRELMVSVWYPARRSERLPLAPQMSPLAAADFDQVTASELGIQPGQVDWAATMTHARVGAPVDRSTGSLPVILFSSGYRVPRTVNTASVEELASRGYIVVSVDHTYEAAQVEFPGGRIERSKSGQTEADLRKAFAVRVPDMTFVLDQLARLNNGHNPDAEHRALPAGLGGSLDLGRVGMLGFSLGGATASQLAHDDRRIDAGVNLDGSHFGSVAQAGLAKPFLQMAFEGHTREVDPTWKSFWEKSTGWKRELRFTGAEHYSFSDFQAMFPQLAGKLENLPVAQFIGTIDPRRSLSAQRAYITAFFDLHLKGRHTRLFDGPAKRYPEVKLIP